VFLHGGEEAMEATWKYMLGGKNMDSIL